ncbi:MAG: DUF3488 domain-containing protein, partial [Planctomycetes bacterium]|nr:DUF3488 domain-containing protein [Planctomycetota bacterium]
MRDPAQVARQTAYQTLSRMAGIVLIVCCVLFQRRGLMHWTELVFLGLCVGLQETFLRLPSLRRLRTSMLVVYSLLPLGLAVMRAGAIMPHRGDFVQLALNTPLPLVLVSVQIMVLYVREAQRMNSVVMVLALFSAVIGVRRPMDDIKWPWIAAIGVLSAVYLVLSHPGAVFLRTLARAPARGAMAQPASRPGSILRGPFLARVPLLGSAVLVMAAALYLGMPRPSFEAPPQPVSQRGQTPLGGPPSQGGGGSQGGGNSGSSGNNQPDQTVSGLAGGVNLGDFGEIKLQKLPALEARPLGRTGVPRTSLYLRAYTFSDFDGQRWTNPNPAVGDLHLLNEQDTPAESRDLPDAPIQFGGAWADRRWAVKYLAAGLGKSGELALPPEALRVSGLGGTLVYDRRTNILRAPAAKAGDEIQVEVRELVALHSQLATALAGSRPVVPPDGERYVRLPPGLKEKVVAVFSHYGNLEKVLTTRPRDPRRPADERTGAFACAVRIVDTFHKAKAAGSNDPAWRYSLEFRPTPGPDAIVHFLDTRASPTAERF